MKIKDAVIALLAILPASPLKNVALRVFGWKIGANSRVGSIIAVRLANVNIGSEVVIHSFSTYRDISLFVGDYSVVGRWNWVSSAVPLKKHSSYRGELRLGKHCGINSRNYFDVSGGVTFGDFSDLAGIRSTFITHQIDHTSNNQTCEEIRIGIRTMVCSNSIFVPGGTVVGDRSIIGMGSVVLKGDYESDSLFAGNPAKFKKQTTGLWFERTHGPAGKNT